MRQIGWLAGIALAACGAGVADPPTIVDAMAAVSLSGSAPKTLGGRSIRVDGVRNGQAAASYGCANTFSTCMVIDKDGVITDSSDMGGLCATGLRNVVGPPGDGRWTMACQAVYKGDKCKGSLEQDLPCAINEGRPVALAPGVNAQEVSVFVLDDSCVEVGGTLTCTIPSTPADGSPADDSHGGHGDH